MPSALGGFIGVVAAPVAAPVRAGGDDRRVVAGRSRGVRAAGRAVRRRVRLRRRRVRAGDRRGRRPARVRQPAAARRPRRGARARVRAVRDSLPARVGGRRHARAHPGRRVAGAPRARDRARVRGGVLRRRAARASRKRGMRTKLLPDSVDRAITRSRRQALGRVRRGFRKPASATGDPPHDPPEAA